MTTQMMHQDAPWPDALAELVGQLSYRAEQGWRVWLSEPEFVRDKPRDGKPGSKGLTLIVLRYGPDAYNPGQIMPVNHYFPVPPATYDRRSWQRWLFDRLGDVEDHERGELFIIDGKRPYAPVHKPGSNPYTVHEVTTWEDVDTDFRGNRVHPGTRAPAE